MSFLQKRLLTLGLLIALLGGGAYLVHWQQQKSEQEAQSADASKKVLAFTDVTQAREVTLTTPKGTFVMVQEGDADGSTRWRLTEPMRTEADATTVQALLEYLAGLRRTHVVTSPENRELFGLAKPRFVVSVKDAQGKVETLEVGEKNSYDGSLFVQTPGAQEVLVVPGSLEYQVDKDLLGLRDKTLVHFHPEDVREIRVEENGKLFYVLKNVDGVWRLTSPIATLADTTQVAGILTALGSVNAKTIAAESATAKELAQYGLAKPRAKITLTFADAKSTTLLFGTLEKPVTQHFAQKDAGPVLDLSTDWAVAKALQSIRDLRDRRVAVFNREDVYKLKLTRGAESLTFARQDKPEVGETWLLTEPEQVKAQDAVVAGVVYRLWNLKANEIVAEQISAQDKQKAQLQEPAMVVELFNKAAEPIARFEFGNLDGEYQFVSGGTRLDIVDKTFSQDIKTDVASYKEDAAANK